MSSLTTSAGSISAVAAAEECYSAEEFDDTRLSLEVGRGTRRPAVQLFGELLTTAAAAQDVHGQWRHRDPTPPAPASGTKKRDSGGVVVTTAARKEQSKKARTVEATQDSDRRSTSQDDGASGGGGGSRKKLRLSAVQATLLEDSFRAHNILSHGEKQELARRVGLSARQVEVWFQNRRARTKLKQTEVDCELLRRWCDRLTDENARLRHDLAQLRSAAAAAVGGVCPSCRDSKIDMAA